VVEHEKSGLIVPACDPESLAEAIKRISEDRPMLESMRAGALRAAQDYSLDRLGRKLVDVCASAAR
jgi:glycosyltransferase involved in cell wall biosynthesis